MTYDPHRHHRQSTRLDGYDYSTPGAYSITVCAQNRACLFGEIIGTEMRLNDAGRMIDHWWNELANAYPQIVLDAYVIMPNHLHGIVVITDSGVHPDESASETTDGEDGHPRRGAPTLCDMAGWFKTMTTNAYIRAVHAGLFPPFDRHLWQRNYHDHITRHDEDLDRIRFYVMTNPARWNKDRNNPARGR